MNDKHIIIVKDGIEYEVKVKSFDLEEDNYKLVWDVVNLSPINQIEYDLSVMNSKLDINKNSWATPNKTTKYNKHFIRSLLLGVL